MKASVQSWLAAIDARSWILHSARTALAAALALGTARLLRLPEPYWAPISTLIVMQSTLGASWAVSRDRLLGTVLGIALGAGVASYVAAPGVFFPIGVFVLGLLCALLHLNLAAYRFAGVTLAIMTLVARGHAVWQIGVHRLLEVSLGILVGLVLSAAWPTTFPPAGERRPTTR